MPVQPTDILDKIEQVAQAFPLDVASSRLLGELELTTTRDAVTEHVSTEAPGFSKAWVQNHAKGQRVVLDLEATDPCVTWDAAKQKFGFAASVPTHPGAPAPELKWWQYPHVTDVTLSIGFDERDCARSARLETRTP